MSALLALSSSLFSFLGGAVFRLVFGEIMAFLNKKVDQAHELLMLEKQGELEERRAKLQQDGIRLQGEMGVKVIEAQREAIGEQLAGEAFVWGVKATTIQTGIRIIDGWNAAIRPGVATWAVFMLTAEAFAWWGLATLDAGTSEVISAALGLFLANRDLHRRGK